MVAAATAVALGRVLDSPLLEAADAKVCVASCVAPAAPGATNCGLDLEPVGEIRSTGGVLQGLVICEAESRSIPYLNLGFPLTYDCRITTLRAYKGYQGFREDPANLRTKAPVQTPAGVTRLSRPGPTFRAHVGDLVQILFLNRIDETKYFKTSTKDACDVVQGVYPGKDTMPNCYHGGNTTNLHFHGTHVSPSRFADNVLIQVLPDPSAKPARGLEMITWLKNNPGKDPTTDPVFKRWKAAAEKRLDAKVTTVAGVDQKLEAAGEWPEYWLGCYPYSFVIPQYGREPVEMGQAPGTHWYHAHKHGAAALQLLNGMSGAFIIEGDYDRELRATLPGIQEKVLVFQQYDSIPNEERANNNKVAPALQANGQLLPTIKMRPGEIQWWRIVNATIQANQINSFAFMESAALDAAISSDARFQIPPVNQRGNTANFRMIARDGVQFAWQNYNRHKADTEFRLAQGNRVDILVQAPLLTNSKPADLVLVFSGLGQSKNPTRQNTVLRVRVENSNGPAVPTQWPPQWEQSGQYLTFPPFLKDLPENLPKRTVTFGIKDPNQGPGLQPQFTIDGKQFEDGQINQCMEFDTMEEWTIINQTTVPHPFHIHVNPFQIIEYFDPSKASEGTKMPAPYVWQDTIEIPANATSPDGKQRDGYVKMRSRFCDFSGKYVLHCHILGHEDRGMMQIVEVKPKGEVCPATPYKTALTHGH